MAHNEEMLKEHGATWGDKVKIIGLSIDKDAPTVKSHIENKDWKRPTHYHRAKSDCSDVYQVKGVPHVLIVDKEGTIVFKGHPANRTDLVKDFNDLLEGKGLDGVEKPGAAGDKEEESGTAVSADDIKKHMEQATKFKEIGKELQTELKEQATGMMRNFCVITVEASYNPTSEKWTSAFTNHRVLVGPSGKVDEC